MELPKKPRCQMFKDAEGYHYVVEAEKVKVGDSPRLDVWWNRGPRKRRTIKLDGKIKNITERDEELIIRQNNGIGADVIIITQGQAYDLLDALNRAMERP